MKNRIRGIKDKFCRVPFFLFIISVFLSCEPNLFPKQKYPIDSVEQEFLIVKEKLTSKKKLHNILLAGASFAHNDNPWFGMLCKELSVTGYNKALSETTIVHTAKLISEGTLYTPSEFEDFEILMIMHTHNRVVDSINSQNKLYQIYSKAWEKVLTTYKKQCVNAEYDSKSKWFGMPNGKPFIVIVLTHWHDGRKVYNNSIRRLQKKKNFILCELDKNIGFNRKELDPLTNKQYSLRYAIDEEIINGVLFGWHPKRYTGSYIQRKIRNIVALKLLDIEN